jgi:hypothetical protein
MSGKMPQKNQCSATSMLRLRSLHRPATRYARRPQLSEGSFSRLHHFKIHAFPWSQMFPCSKIIYSMAQEHIPWPFRCRARCLLNLRLEGCPSDSVGHGAAWWDAVHSGVEVTEVPRTGVNSGWIRFLSSKIDLVNMFLREISKFFCWLSPLSDFQRRTRRDLDADSSELAFSAFQSSQPAGGGAHPLLARARLPGVRPALRQLKTLTKTIC